jgi:hypothetical protein
MFAATCFGPIGPSSESLCWALLKIKFCGISTSLYVQQCCGKSCGVCCVQCTALHTTHTAAWNTFYHNISEHITAYFYWLFPQNCNFSKVRHRLPDDGPDGPKYVGAIMRYFNCTFQHFIFSIKGCICWSKEF